MAEGEMLTPEQRVARALEVYPGGGSNARNDSWLLPVDLRERLAAEIREAVAEATQPYRAKEWVDGQRGLQFKPATGRAGPVRGEVCAAGRQPGSRPPPRRHFAPDGRF